MLQHTTQFKQSYTYADIGLVPTKMSTIESREDVNTTSLLWGLEMFHLRLPIIASPMESVTNPKMLGQLEQHSLVGMLPRGVLHPKAWEASIVSVGSTGNFLSEIDNYYERGVRIFCIDVANGFHRTVGAAIGAVRTIYGDDIKIITGNVASVEGYKYLAQAGVNAVRVGIGNGSACTTSIATGVGNGQASLIREIAIYRNTWRYPENAPLIFADGGVKTPGCIAKAIALGTDFVMSGSLFAGLKEAPGPVIKHRGKLYKHYAGQASKYVKGNNSYIEGADQLVEYRGTLEETVKTLSHGLKSSMAYMNCKTLDEFRYLPDENFVILSDAAKMERTPHAA